MSDLVGTQIVGFLTHRLNYDMCVDLSCSLSLLGPYQGYFEVPKRRVIYFQGAGEHKSQENILGSWGASKITVGN